MANDSYTILLPLGSQRQRFFRTCAAKNNKADSSADFIVNPAEQFFEVAKSNITHMSDSEGLFF